MTRRHKYQGGYRLPDVTIWPVDDLRASALRDHRFACRRAHVPRTQERADRVPEQGERDAMTVHNCNCPACRERRRVVQELVRRIAEMQAKHQAQVERSSGANRKEATPR